MTCIFSNGNQFSYFLFVPLLPTWLSLRTHTVMHTYWGYPHIRNYATVDNALKIMTFFSKIHILHLYVLRALRYILQWIFCVGYIHVSHLLPKMTNELRSPCTYFCVMFLKFPKLRTQQKFVQSIKDRISITYCVFLFVVQWKAGYSESGEFGQSCKVAQRKVRKRHSIM